MIEMLNVLKRNKKMVATLLSGILILIGFYAQTIQLDTESALIFIGAFLIGGYSQAKEGIIDTVRNKRLNVDVLMVLAAIGASLIGYWFEGALLIFIFSLSGSLEHYAQMKSSDAIRSLMTIVPQTAQRYQLDGSLEQVDVNELTIGDRVFVAKGESVPIDGLLTSAFGMFDESSINGESMPSEKTKDQQVYAGSINLQEAVTINVNKQADDTLFAQVIRLVTEAQNTPSKTARLITKLENYYVSAVLIFVSLMLFIFYFVLDWGWSESFYRSMVLLTVASPCALVASAVPATLSAISNAAKAGILFKGGIAIENLAYLDCIAFDKTATLTNGKPVVTDYAIDDCYDEEEVLSIVYALEEGSTHPIAAAFINFIEERPFHTLSLLNKIDSTGFGLSAHYHQIDWRIGKADFIDGVNPFSKETQRLSEEGKTLIYLAADHQIFAYFALLDTVKEEAKDVIRFFKARGIQTVMLTGDQFYTAQAIAHELELDDYYANCLPAEKATLIDDLQKKYKRVAMVGDGINDAPALAHSDIGIAMGQGTDIAMQTADVVLINNSLSLLPYSVLLSKRLRKITLQNIVFSLAVIIVLITTNLLQLINLPLGVVGHEGSTILVILNGLRLLAFKHKESHQDS